MTIKFKIYSTDIHILNKVCVDYGLKPDLLKEGKNILGAGYCSDGDKLRVFVCNSSVDLDKEIEDITSVYVEEVFTL